jgi:hypothetical protein
LHALVCEELFIVIEDDRENFLSKEVKALAQAGTQAVLFAAPLLTVVVNIFD